ncbi:hypothetical protein ACGC1H_007002 [Rhizoctonia solani]|uniref:Conidiation-specific protein 6 n=1 Tax=Rhizoctonia solani TaxID=456999 RepID=A0A8H2Y344_9AGAM|nr:unnamed protein product [Rhizoctonia solani]
MSDAHENHVLGGYKATLSNPNTSDEAKAHAEEVLANAGVEVNNNSSDNTKGTSASTHRDEHENRVLGGHKATLSNPNTSNEAKEHAQEVLANADVSDTAKGQSTTGDSEHEKRVLAGYKGVLSNDNTSEEAKEKARAILSEAGELH